ncbi:amidohydrolase [Granulosicoccus antarcticus]|uniref:Putative hydrolase YxeP n=1 Tax=Granulosicoccus antarcticus IMCC3135 TaxID=1192854 RepID=A0A2Z2NUS0_9GAMM|nr:amidohydrolase [Granulosicoccus antarcticus]ASJ72520.1 putative hydrolase YxeP [Granulosicoccus antarcticus IMCC3135]
MRSTDRLHNLLPEIIQWRRDIHRHPELGYDVQRTAGFVAQKLRSFGFDEVVEGVGKTGVVGVIRGRSHESGKIIGLRADMDALPIVEASGAPWSSETDGRMHACGHDGHTAMLLGAARALADARDFDGSVVFIFQPAEEGGAGGLAMVEDEMMDRFGIQEVYGLHNMPDLPIGEFAIRPGPLMACADEFDIVVQGRGGHAAMPHDTIDPVVVAAHIVLALQSIVSRGARPTDPLVVSVTTLEVEGGAYNVIPQSVHMRGTLRAFDENLRVHSKQRIIDIAQQSAQVFGASAQVDYRDGYPPTVNHVLQTQFVIDVASKVVGSDKVDPDRVPMMAAEDFSYMLNERPGAFIFMGNGESASLHHPQYDFNDEAIRYGCEYWMTLVSEAMPLANS